MLLVSIQYVNQMVAIGCSTRFRQWPHYNPVRPYRPVDTPPVKKHTTVYWCALFCLSVLSRKTFVLHQKLGYPKYYSNITFTALDNWNFLDIIFLSWAPYHCCYLKIITSIAIVIRYHWPFRVLALCLNYILFKYNTYLRNILWVFIFILVIAT